MARLRIACLVLILIILLAYSVIWINRHITDAENQTLISSSSTSNVVNVTKPVYQRSKLPNEDLDNYDNSGVAIHNYGGECGIQFNPLFIANAALTFYQDLTQIPVGYSPDVRYKDAFMIQVNWLEKNAIYTKMGMYFPYSFNYEKMVAPWFSSITQARVAKVFTNAYNLTHEEKYKIYAKDAVKILFEDVNNDGFTFKTSGYKIYEEYTQPYCNHSLNAHLSVILDLIDINKVLQNEEIWNMIDSDVEAAKGLIPLFENLNEMSWALYLPRENISSISTEELMDNTYYSYDLIHMKYIYDLYQYTHDEAFKELFFRYYGSMCLRDIWETGKNTLCEKNGTTIVESSGFSKDEKNSLSAAFLNYRLNPQIYAAGETGDVGYFIAQFNKPYRLSKLELRFHWADYPRKILLQGFSDTGWETIDIDSEYRENQIYKQAVIHDNQITKIKFSASDFTGQQRLLLDYINVEVADDEKYLIWVALKDEEILKAVNIEAILADAEETNRLGNILYINKNIIDNFVKLGIEHNFNIDEMYQYAKDIIDIQECNDIEHDFFTVCKQYI